MSTRLLADSTCITRVYTRDDSGPVDPRREESTTRMHTNTPTFIAVGCDVGLMMRRQNEPPLRSFREVHTQYNTRRTQWDREWVRAGQTRKQTLALPLLRNQISTIKNIVSLARRARASNGVDGGRCWWCCVLVMCGLCATRRCCCC